MNCQWKRLSKGNRDPIRMFCFPYSGGTAQVFLPLARVMPQGVGVYALELPGRGRRFRENLPESLSFMVDESMEGIIPLVGTGDFMFFGHSLGGLIAFELARNLRYSGLPLPRHLFLSGVRAPHIPRREEPMHDLPHDAFVEKLRQMGGTPDEVLENQELLELMVPILRKDFQIYETYRYNAETALECPITAFGGIHDRYAKPDDVNGWSEHTNRLFSSYMLDGGHFFINSHLKDVRDIILKTLTLHKP